MAKNESHTINNILIFPDIFFFFNPITKRYKKYVIPNSAINTNVSKIKVNETGILKNWFPKILERVYL
jgi:predicted ATPase